MPEIINLQRLIQFHDRHGRSAAAVASAALAILVAWQLAGMVWNLLPPPEAGRWQAPLSPAQTPPGQPRGVSPVAALLKSDLFGHYTAPTAPVQKAENAPDTRLSLRLMGILAGPESESRALISSGSGNEKPYAIGDDVVSGVSLEAIYPDRVILERDGRYETLRLVKDAPSTGGSKYVPPSPAADASTSQLLSQIRTEIMADPTKAANYLRVQPFSQNGQLRGYRIYPGRDRKAFSELGLRPGDLVTSINGVQLDDNQKALQLLGQLSQANAVNLTLERGGQTRTMNLTLY